MISSDQATRQSLGELNLDTAIQSYCNLFHTCEVIYSIKKYDFTGWFNCIILLFATTLNAMLWLYFLTAPGYVLFLYLFQLFMWPSFHFLIIFLHLLIFQSVSISWSFFLLLFTLLISLFLPFARFHAFIVSCLKSFLWRPTQPPGKGQTDRQGGGQDDMRGDNWQEKKMEKSPLTESGGVEVVWPEKLWKSVTERDNRNREQGVDWSP